ncbi:MAG: hypothetical protein ABH833_01630 [Parcubacteria group bacterium]
MQKITLKPSFSEVVLKTDEPNTYFDVFSYEGTSVQEKSLGSLFIVTHIKYDEKEDLSYILSLLSSLAKREYYSEYSVKLQDPKKAFQSTLKKLNEVLEDFFKNKEFSLNVGLLATSGENVYISKLGKFKVGLARDDEYIDVLNNIELFEKSEKSEQQFSNIISGKLESGDKLFAYFPVRALTSREKKLNNIFVNEDKEKFVDAIKEISEKTKDFVCCGVYIDIQEIKEIPVGAPSYTEEGKKMVYGLQAKHAIGLASVSDQSDKNEENDDKESDEDKERGSTSISIDEDDEDEEDVAVEVSHQGNPEVMSAELAVGKRSNMISSIGSKMRSLTSVSGRRLQNRVRGFVVIALIIIIPLVLIIALRDRTPDETKTAYNNAQQEYQLAEDNLNQNNQKAARGNLLAALGYIDGILEDDDVEVLRTDISSKLDDVDKVSTDAPSIFYKNTDTSLILSKLTVIEGMPYAIINTGEMFRIDEESTKSLNSFDISPAKPLTMFSTDIRLSSYTDDNRFAVYNLETENFGLFTLDTIPDTQNITDATLYADNLYLVINNGIYRYADANTGEETFTRWLDSEQTGTIQSITVDGDVFALTNDGRIFKYFKGEKEDEFNLDLVLSNEATIHTLKDAEYLYIFEKGLSRLFVLNKEDGSLVKTYKINADGPADDVAFDLDGTIWILSGSDIWTIGR